MQPRTCDERFLKGERPSLSLLTPEQMVRLTGRRKKSLQVQWLKENSVPHYVNAEGYPQVFESLVPAKAAGDFELGEVR